MPNICLIMVYKLDDNNISEWEGSGIIPYPTQNSIMGMFYIMETWNTIVMVLTFIDNILSLDILK